MERLFNLDPQLLHDAILLGINIFILFIILSYVLFNPVRKVLQDRKNKIASDIKEAEDYKKEADKLKVDYENKLKDIDLEAKTILSDARKKALDNENAIINDAKLKSESIITQAKNQADLESQRIRNEVKDEIINTSTLLASKILEEEIDESKASKYIDEAIDEVSDKEWQN